MKAVPTSYFRNMWSVKVVNYLIYVSNTPCENLLGLPSLHLRFKEAMV